MGGHWWKFSFFSVKRIIFSFLVWILIWIELTVNIEQVSLFHFSFFILKKIIFSFLVWFSIRIEGTVNIEQVSLFHFSFFKSRKIIFLHHCNYNCNKMFSNHLRSIDSNQNFILNGRKVRWLVDIGINERLNGHEEFVFESRMKKSKKNWTSFSASLLLEW